MKIVRLPKKSGGVRTIYVPDPAEKEEFRALVPELARLAAQRCPAAHAFVAGRSPVTAARLHVAKKVTLSWDLRDFFDSCCRDQIVREGVSEEVLDRILVDGAPRQGLPTSPAAANLAAAEMDRAILAWIADIRGAVYTRYADDLAISLEDASDRLVADLLHVIPAIVRQAGFEIHPRKTRVQFARAGRRVICGVAVGDTEQTYATRAARRRLRAAEHRASLPVRDRERAAQQAHGLREWCAQRLPVAARLDERTGGRGASLAEALDVASRRERRRDVRAQIEQYPIRDYLRAARWLAAHDAQKSWAGGLAATFGPAWQDWVCGFDQENLHDACFWLPTDVLPVDGLGARLLKWRREIPDLMSRVKDLALIARSWSRMGAELRESSLAELVRRARTSRYSRVQHAGFAAECAEARCTEAEYHRFERRWLRAIAAVTHESIPRVTAQYAGYSARVLDRDDPRGLWIGQYTACCQHPFGEARSSAWHAVSSPDGAILVVEHDGGIVAQSWLWRSGDIVVADNCEALRGHDKETLLALYRNWAAAAIGRLGVSEVRVGTLGDLDLSGLPREKPVPTPRGTYTDAKCQVCLARLGSRNAAR